MRLRNVVIVITAALAVEVACTEFSSTDDGGTPAPIDTPETGAPPLADAAGPSDANPVDASADATLTFVLDGGWRGLNGATATAVDGGVRIGSYVPAANHPIIVPMPNAPIPSDDYSVHAVVRALGAGEFGVVVRIPEQEDRGVVFGSRYGSGITPFLGTVAASDAGRAPWDPTPVSIGSAYTFATGTLYHLRVTASGTTIQGKLWADGAEEPGWQAVTIAMNHGTGRLVGFYTYLIVDAVLERYEVTIP